MPELWTSCSEALWTGAAAIPATHGSSALALLDALGLHLHAPALQVGLRVPGDGLGPRERGGPQPEQGEGHDVQEVALGPADAVFPAVHQRRDRHLGRRLLVSLQGFRV